MINLKLAQSNLEGKFQRFLELGKSFGYFGDTIMVLKIFGEEFNFQKYINNNDQIIHLAPNDICNMRGKDDSIINVITNCAAMNDREGQMDDIAIELFNKDEKDPLNRFNGLFNGRTYGEGRFVLVKDNDFAIIKKETRVINKMEITGDFVVGNLFENPELYEKVK